MAHPRDKAHARIYRVWMDLPAWTTLSAVAQALIVNIMTRYRPMEPNRFEISDRTATTLVRAARKTAAKALAELVDRGWLSEVRVGRLQGPKARRASVYALTTFSEDGVIPATKRFLTWQPDPVQGLKVKPSTAQIRSVNGSLQVLSSDPAQRPAGAATH